MDISKFNKLLALLIKKAEMAENSNNLVEAIDTWIEITELTIKTSKNPKLDFTFRNMLYTRTEGLINHIKELKIKFNSPKPKSIKREPPKIEKKENIKQSVSNNQLNPPKIIENEPNFDENLYQIRENKFKAIQQDFEIIKNSEFKNMPKGVQEIKANKDFNILTPHDPEYVDKRLKQEIDMSVFSSKNDTNKQQIELEKKNKNGLYICFACGEKNPPNSKRCKTCGTEL
ncbi:MAG: zinc ribbon domain-containing protein [Candidatus Lokiarchaeota archaeon]|nr:zinc ribbon domain-containing protein [Candidatus Lokiarchaeota archaeon]